MKKVLLIVAAFCLFILSFNNVGFGMFRRGKSSEQKYEIVKFNKNWEFAGFSKINTGEAHLYRCEKLEGRKNVIVAVLPGHGTKGGNKQKTLCHPDGSPKLTGGSTSEGEKFACAENDGMTHISGTPEPVMTLRVARFLKDRLLDDGYDVLMLRDGEDTQLDVVAKTVMSNNCADLMVSLHFTVGSGFTYDKGCFFISVPDGLKDKYPVKNNWKSIHILGNCLIEGLSEEGCEIFNEKGCRDVDLMQTAYSSIPNVCVELGNRYTDTSDEHFEKLASGVFRGIKKFTESSDFLKN